jgi:hypothetical protein
MASYMKYNVANILVITMSLFLSYLIRSKAVNTERARSDITSFNLIKVRICTDSIWKSIILINPKKKRFDKGRALFDFFINNNGIRIM